MRLIILMLVFINTVLLAQNLNYSVLNKHAYVIPENSYSVKIGYLTVNDTVDIFNIKDKELDGLEKFGAIGDMNGYDIEFRYGITNNDMIIFNNQKWSIGYTDSTLDNNRFDILNRYNIFNSQYSFFNSLSVDIGYIQNSADDLILREDSYINAMIQKIEPDTTIKIEDGNIVQDDVSVTLLDKNGEKIYPSITIGDLSDKSYYGRLLLAKKFSSTSLLDLYLGYKTTKVTTKISFNPKDNEQLNKYLNNHNEITNLDRSEHNIDMGFLYTYKNGRYIYEFNYEYNRVSRGDNLDYMNHNSIINISIGKKYGKNLLIYVAGRLMLSQFNTDITYLYDKYTQTQFDKKYGFAQLGFVYNF